MAAKVSEVEILKKDIAELTRAVNTQARVLHAMIQAHDYVVKAYMEILKVEKPNEEKKEDAPK